LLRLHVANAKEEIIQQQRINGQPRINWSLVSIAGFAKNILRIKKRDKDNAILKERLSSSSYVWTQPG
jgi:hypothetical protein